jgi:hypothetical protein
MLQEDVGDERSGKIFIVCAKIVSEWILWTKYWEKERKNPLTTRKGKLEDINARRDAGVPYLPRDN